jgi:DNA ligase (NAD+)
VAHVADLDEFRDWSLEKFQEVEDIGPKVAQSLFDFFHTESNLKMIDELRGAGVNTRHGQKKKTAGGKLDGITFLFTGTLTMKRSDAEALAEKNGGIIQGSVTSKLNYLVVGENAGSKLDKAKKLGTVKIINEQEFLQLMAEGE